MSDSTPKSADADAGNARVRLWLDIRAPLERQLAPLGRAAIDRLRLAPGDRVLDIGPGIGGTPRALADIVGPEGEVVGIDVLAAALDVLRSETGGLPGIDFVNGDAEIHRFAPGGFNAAFSRFGVMVFADPVAAFANIGRALRPGGRLAFVCWRRLADNDLDAFPLAAASLRLPPGLVRDAQHAPHFAFADRDVIHTTLTRAGYTDIDIRPHDEDVRTGDLASTVAVCSRVGSLGALLREHPEHRRAAVAALERALAPRNGPAGPALRAAVWVVTAVTPAGN